ncbi:MAG: phtE [Gammaproteobacteria bacterium]|jgi:sugar phosphate permease|nr:phtE [Gammaproteobacteria bacterium]
MIKKRQIYNLTPWIICALGALYYCYEYFLRISPSVMIQELMKAYNLTGAQAGSLSAFYYHAYVPMQIIVGLMMDRYGPRRLLVMACMCCAVGTYLFAGTQSIIIAELGRFFIGFGSAFAFVGALKLATIWLPPNRFALISGIITSLGMIGAMAGDIMLRSLVDAMGWKLTTYVSAGVGVVLALILWAVVRDVNPSPTHPNYHVRRLSFHDLLLGLWGALRNPQIWFNGMLGFLLYLSLSAFGELWGIPYLEQARGLSKMQAANANAMIFLGWAIGSPCWGWFSDFIERRCAPLFMASIATLLVACVILYVPNLSFFSMSFLLFFFGLLSSVQVLVFAICREVTHFRIAGTAIALTNMFVMIGGNFFQPVIGKLLDMGWSGALMDGTRVYSALAYQAALSVIPVGILFAIILTFFVRETHGLISTENK